jgi:hypothetical protein
MANHLTLPIQPDPHEMSSFWNPVCAGSFLLYTTYYLNVELGSTMMDAVGQVRTVLHLYHAAKQRQLLHARSIPIFDCLDGMFASSKAIWGMSGTKPKKGNFAKQYLVSLGYDSVQVDTFLQAVKVSTALKYIMPPKIRLGL